MFTVRSTAVGDNLTDPTPDEGHALLLAVQHVRDNGADADVYFEDEYRWYIEADTKGDLDPAHPVIVHDVRVA